MTISDMNGTILRVVSCPEIMASIQVQSGEVSINGMFDGETHFIDTQLMVAVAKPARPAGDVEFYIPTRSWVQIQRTAAELIAAAIATRSQLLAQSDWSQLPDVPSVTQLLWRGYRQKLRDITLQAGYPQTIVWPSPPV